jgi:hypothetical protein
MASWDNHRVHIVDVQKLKVTACFSEHRAPVTLLAAAGEWLASADVSGCVHLFNLDSLRHQARVPAGNSQEFPTAMRFDLASKCLLIALSSHKVIIYDVETLALRTGLPSLVLVPAKVLPLHERICSITTLPDRQDRLILAGSSFMLALDLQQLASAEHQPRLAKDEIVGDDGETQKKRRKKVSLEGREESASSKWHISDHTDISPCAWRTYPKMALRHIFGVWALDGSRWGKAVLAKHYLQSGTKTPPEEDTAGQDSAKRKRMEIEAMLLTLEVAPETVERLLPESFERKKYLATQ